jgi:protein involved in polysaccharide export with SLBB domain
LLSVDLERILAGDDAADVVLEPYDVLNIREIPNWRELEQAQVFGEVRFPGTYPIRRGETLSSLIQRAGGLTETAFPDGAVFLREDLRYREQLQLDELATRLQGEIKSDAAAEPESAEIATARLALLEQVRETKATGRLVISLREILAGTNGPGSDVVLQDGDRLLVPQASQTVTVIGEVQFPTSHVFENELGRNEYIGRSGGMTADADEHRIYVVHADGAVEPGKRSLFFRSRSGGDIRPGDTIVVPLDADRMSQLSLWTNITTIIYNIGVAAAAVASF